METIDRIYTSHPYYGSRRITKTLRRMAEWGDVNRKRVSRLMSLMGISAIYPKPKTSGGNREHEKYPYLLKGVSVERPNQVWCSDITYIPTEKGFVYLAAIMDWYSRYVLSWELSNSMESSFCARTLERAIERHGEPDIFNTDQGAQFTDHRFTDILEKHGIKISMDGRGRCMDNIFIERLWRSVKYEEVYLKSYETLPEARAGLKEYFAFYNGERLHQSLNYNSPAEVHFGESGGGFAIEQGSYFS
jgi:putative transposase